MTFIPGQQSLDIPQNDSNSRHIFTDKTKITPLWTGKKAQERETRVTILPAMDWTMYPADTAFFDSAVSYITGSPDQGAPSHSAFSSWFMPMEIYNYIDPTGDTIISPTARAGMMGAETLTALETRDAFADVSKACWSSGLSVDDKKLMTRGKYAPMGGGTKATIPCGKMVVAVQVMVQDNQSAEARAQMLFLTPAAATELQRQLRIFCPAGVVGITPRDPKNSQYIFGDITDPANALRLGFQKRKVGDKDINVLRMSSVVDVLDPTPDNVAIPAAILKQRIPLWDPSYWNFMSYQDMVDYMVEDIPDIPMEYIIAGCGKYANIKERRNAVVSSPAAPAMGVPAAAMPPQVQTPMVAAPPVAAASVPAAPPVAAASVPAVAPVAVPVAAPVEAVAVPVVAEAPAVVLTPAEAKAIVTTNVPGYAGKLTAEEELELGTTLHAVEAAALSGGIPDADSVNVITALMAKAV